MAVGGIAVIVTGCYWYNAAFGMIVAGLSMLAVAGLWSLVRRKGRKT